MRTQKPYTNTTFTKRVDHEGGEHREAMAGHNAVCKTCGAVFENKRWISGMRARALHIAPPKQTVECPACKQVAAGTYGGEVTIDGKFYALHHVEIDSLLRNEELRAREDNPISRIMSWNAKKGLDTLDIETTTDHLAQRLGHVLKKAYSGELQYNFSHENKVVRVSWHRD